MQIDAGLDTGPMLLKEEIEILPEDDAVTLAKRMAPIGAALLARTLDGLNRGVIAPVPQDQAAATLAPMLRKQDGRADWTMTAVELRNRVRGLQAWPGLWTSFRGKVLKIERLATEGTESTEEERGMLVVRGHRLFVSCGSGVAELLEVQPEGRRRMSAVDFLNGYRIDAGEKLLS
jgi:methionyl-tRNA formyltransferase